MDPRKRLIRDLPKAELHVHIEASDHIGQQLAVASAPKGCIEVDEVDPLGTGLLPGAGCRPRVAV